MEDILVYPAGIGSALEFACAYLEKHGIPLVDHPTPEITHLLLDVPCRGIPGGLLERLPENLCVVGGNLELPELADYRKLDLLRREEYLAKNAAITADCALRVAAERMKTVFADSPALIIGWGRIGKCLASLLKSVGCPVTVAARKEANRAMLEALGYRTADTGALNSLQGYRLVFNTAPAPVLRTDSIPHCRDCLMIDLASRRGLEGDNIIWARGLPGKYAPESSGRLIAETFLNLYKEGTT